MYFKLSCVDSILNCLYCSINMNRFTCLLQRPPLVSSVPSWRPLLLVLPSWCPLRLVVLVQQAAPAAIFHRVS